MADGEKLQKNRVSLVFLFLFLFFVIVVSPLGCGPDCGS
jgi:hypothetical protein